MRTLAIDLGAARVGLAISDESGRWASPLEVVAVKSPEHARNEVAMRVKKHGAGQVVVGVPLNMDGTFGAPAREAMKWGRQLAEACGMQAVFIDERLSSFAADGLLAEQRRMGSRLTRKKKKARQDALAACDFLQAYLDGRLIAIENA